MAERRSHTTSGVAGTSATLASAPSASARTESLRFRGVTNPDTTLATVLSLIPPFTPFLMIVRTSVMVPPFWEIALSVLSLLAGIAVMTWLAAKIFRIGILMTGKKPTFKEIFRWLRYA